MTGDAPPMAGLRLLLVRLMGSGNSSVGRAVAARLGLPYVDNDLEIAELAGEATVELARRGGDELHRWEAVYASQLQDRPAPFVAGLPPVILLKGRQSSPSQISPPASSRRPDITPPSPTSPLCALSGDSPCRCWRHGRRCDVCRQREHDRNPWTSAHPPTLLHRAFPHRAGRSAQMPRVWATRAMTSAMVTAPCLAAPQR